MNMHIHTHTSKVIIEAQPTDTIEELRGRIASDRKQTFMEPYYNYQRFL